MWPASLLRALTLQPLLWLRYSKYSSRATKPVVQKIWLVIVSYNFVLPLHFSDFRSWSSLCRVVHSTQSVWWNLIYRGLCQGRGPGVVCVVPLLWAFGLYPCLLPVWESLSRNVIPSLRSGDVEVSTAWTFDPGLRAPPGSALIVMASTALLRLCWGRCWSPGPFPGAHTRMPLTGFPCKSLSSHLPFLTVFITGWGRRPA